MKKRGKATVDVKTIPLAEIPAAALAEAKIIGPRKASRSSCHRSQQPNKRVRVLVIDDDSSIANSSAQLLGLFGYECYAAYNPSDALAAAESFAPDVVLSDVIMDGMNGVDLCLQIKKILPDCRFLLFSGEVPTAYALMQDAGKQGHHFELLAKPLRSQELVAKIENLFGGVYSPGSTQAHA